jgi:hypothetical protein
MCNKLKGKVTVTTNEATQETLIDNFRKVLPHKRGSYGKFEKLKTKPQDFKITRTE